jgi:hypothetical protein
MPASAGSRNALTAFFIPGQAAETPASEGCYTLMRNQLANVLGHLPSNRRILELWTRRGRVDCVTRVGTPDPICGELVIAIFDMGPHQPFVIWRQCEETNGGLDADRSYEVVGCNAYSVLEFEA